MRDTHTTRTCESHVQRDRIKIARDDHRPIPADDEALIPEGVLSRASNAETPFLSLPLRGGNGLVSIRDVARDVTN